MIERPYWLSRIHAGWKKRPIVWMAGVRAVGGGAPVAVFELIGSEYEKKAKKKKKEKKAKKFISILIET
jgi:hypothetical protein